ncbi:hypothetical protein EXIGLDRAFT_384799 [Exidia glandulosa HHB12029]|uniref:Uncharacterized protein n=1 Tax=Exidia glandulosa HHB12029 TaxID=1314781 RepID=A0A165BWY8_EXIGL|nr:hypothetical protein EXIGLDRAFT_384799 [Exidia glandulosa HHB12029]
MNVTAYYKKMARGARPIALRLPLYFLRRGKRSVILRDKPIASFSPALGHATTATLEATMRP